MKYNIKQFLQIFGMLFCITLSSCVSSSVANLQRSSEKEVTVFTTLKPNKEYIELQYIQVDGSIFHKPEKLMKKLSQRAKKEGADAVINVKYDFQWTWPIVSGTAIKYK